MNKKGILGYGILFLLFLILAKIGYLALESAYNTLILDSATIKEPTEKIYENYQNLGHFISALGATILLLGIYYKLFSYPSFFSRIKNPFYIKNGLLRAFVFATVVFGTYKGIYVSLEHTLNYIVKKNMDKKYEAYYLNLLKNGIAQGIFKAGDFIDTDGNKIDVKQKVFLNNIFLLTFIDKKVADKVADKAFDYYASQRAKQIIKENEENYKWDFKTMRDKVYEAYKLYTTIENKGNEQYQNILKKQDEFEKGFNLTYNLPLTAYRLYLNALKLAPFYEKTTLGVFKSKDFQQQWNKFVKYYNEGYKEEAMDSYKSKMLSFFPEKIPSPSVLSKALKEYYKFYDDSKLRELAKESVRQWWRYNPSRLTYLNEINYLFHQPVKKAYAKLSEKEKRLNKEAAKFANDTPKEYFLNDCLSRFKIYGPKITFSEFIRRSHMYKPLLKLIQNLYLYPPTINMSQLAFYKPSDAQISFMNEHTPKLTKYIIQRNRKKAKEVYLTLYKADEKFSKATKELIAKVKEELEKRGLGGIPLNLSFREFVLNPVFQKKLKEKIIRENGRFDEKIFKDSLKLIAYHKEDYFLVKVLYPDIKAKIKSLKLSREKLENNPKYDEYGIKALKALFIPPFAVTLSLIFGILNLLTLLGIFAATIAKLILGTGIRIQSVVKNAVVLSGLAALGFYLFSYKPNSVYDAFLSKTDNPYIKAYIRILPNLTKLEEMNYEIGKKIRKIIFNEKDYGLGKKS